MASMGISMRIAKLLFLVLLVASPAMAQDSKPSLKLPTVVFTAGATADWITTYRNVTRGGSEANPLLRPLREHPKALVATGAAMDVAGVLIWNHYMGRNHPKLGMVGLCVAAGARFYMAYKNNQRLNEHLAGKR